MREDHSVKIDKGNYTTQLFPNSVDTYVLFSITILPASSKVRLDVWI